jgi:flagellar biosynthesis/type III secretory pathway M-ring protein FliF/YscJ
MIIPKMLKMLMVRNLEEMKRWTRSIYTMVLGIIILIVILAIIANLILVRCRKNQEPTSHTPSTEQPQDFDEEPVQYKLDSEEDEKYKEKETVYQEDDEYERIYGAVGSVVDEDDNEWITDEDEEESEEIDWDDE